MPNTVTITLTPVSCLKSWHTLNVGLREFDEAGVQEMLEHELENRKRPDFVRRIHQRLGKLQRAREREELLQCDK